MGLGPISSGHLIPQNGGLFYAGGGDEDGEIDPQNLKTPSVEELDEQAQTQSGAVLNSDSKDWLVNRFWNNLSTVPVGAMGSRHDLPLVSSPAVEFVTTNSTAMGVATRVSDAFSAMGDFAGEHPVVAAVGTVALVAGVAAIGVATGVISAPVAIGVGIFAGVSALFA